MQRIMMGALAVLCLLAAYPSSLTASAPVTLPQQQGCTNRAAFVADVTIPDDSVFQLGSSFTKTWRIRNTGTCTWTTGYRLVFVNGTQMGNVTSVALPRRVAPGATVDLSVPLVAPETSGSHRANWRLQSATGARFGPTLSLRILASVYTATSIPDELYTGGWGGGPSCWIDKLTDEPIVDASDQAICLLNFPPYQPFLLTLTSPDGRRFTRVLRFLPYCDGRTAEIVGLTWSVERIPGRWVLEIIGAGYNSAHGIDISPEMLAKGSSQFGGPHVFVREPNPLQKTSYAPGEPVTVEGIGYPPNSVVLLAVYSGGFRAAANPRFVDGSYVTTDSAGAFRTTVIAVLPYRWAYILAFSNLGDVQRPEDGTFQFEGSLDKILIAPSPIVGQECAPGDGGVSCTGVPKLGAVFIPAGDFLMGSDDAQIAAALDECNATEGNCQPDWFASEAPQRSTWVDAFSIATFETTNSLYAQCVDAGACAPAGRAISDTNIAYDPDFFEDDRPVVGVSRFDAESFCAWVGGRLPTEAEWEKAARGTDARRYPWGDFYAGEYANLGSGFPSAVGAYPVGASAYGVQDMAGNAFEWTATVQDGRTVLRGGSWLTPYFRGRVADRGTRLDADFANYDIGFRCAFSDLNANN